MNAIVSIVVATKSDLACLKQFVASLPDLAELCAEVIIIDGGSSDGTVTWLQTAIPNGRSPMASWVSVPDSGIAEAWNRGVRLASGHWVLFLGADDRISDTAAWHTATERLRSLPPECGVVAFPVRMVTSRDTIVADEAPRLGTGGGRFPAVNTIPHQGAFHRRSLWDSHGDFDTSYSIAADYEFLLRLWSAGVEIRACDSPPPVAMAFGGVSKRNPLKNLKEFRRAQRLHGVELSSLQRSREWAFAAARSGVAALLGESFARRLADCGRRIRGLQPIWTVS